jgi:hypothetical protein
MGERMEEDLQQLMAMLAAATSQISAEYFQLPVADADAVYRERVYCYELYHRLRAMWDAFPFSLGGEVDKVGHPAFQDGPYARAKPDFLVHTPGAMDQNLAVIEVKPATASVMELGRDLLKLSWFCENARYSKGILVVYGDAGSSETFQQKLRDAVGGVDTTLLTSLYHRNAGSLAQELRF